MCHGFALCNVGNRGNCLHAPLVNALVPLEMFQ